MEIINKFSNRIILILSLLFLLSITLSTVNAAENTTNLGNLITNAPDNSVVELGEGTYKTNVTNINIAKNITIVGKGASKTTIDANKEGRIFYIQNNGILTLINITLINGNASEGGAIYNTGKLTITDCTLCNNVANYNGAAIRSIDSNLIINKCNFINNTVGDSGGAITVDNSNITMTNSNFTNNSAMNFGGAFAIIVYEYDYIFTAIISGCNFNNNNATYGGAMTNIANMTLSNTNFNNNNATYGGAIFNLGNITIDNCNFLSNNLSAIYSTYELEGQRFSNSTDTIILNCNFSDNELAIYSNGNITIQGCNIINNTKGIIVTNESTNTTINYNRIFNNTDYDLNNTGSNTNADFNWWGNNTPDLAKILGLVLNNYYVMNVTNLTSLDSNGTLRFNYTFGLNTNENAKNSLLPYFTTDVYTNVTDGVIVSFDARYEKAFDVTLNYDGEVLYNFVTDNEVQTLKGTTTIPEPIGPVDPIDPIDPVEPLTPIDPDDIKNQTTNNPAAASATMKETGIPIIAIIIVLVSTLGLLIRKK